MNFDYGLMGLLLFDVCVYVMVLVRWLLVCSAFLHVLFSINITS